MIAVPCVATVSCSATSASAPPSPATKTARLPPLASKMAASATTSTVTTARTTTSTATTATTVVRPSLPAPRPIAALVSPSLPGEGSWQPAGDRLAGGFAIYTTELRPTSGQPEAGIAWINPQATVISLYAGVGQPHGSWPQQGYVASAAQPRMIAAFNSGSKIYKYQTGWYDQGQAAVPLQAGAASLVIYRDGTASVADWGRDATMGPDVIAVRQNLTLLVDHGAPTPAVQDPSLWGAVLGGGYITWRSGIGVTETGDLVYAGGPDLTPALLAELLAAAGAERAMQLDINPEWVSFAAFNHTGGSLHRSR